MKGNNNTKKILVIDDEPAICSLCERILDDNDMEVNVFTECRTAQKTFENNEYDLCLVDIRMPPPDGKEFYQWLQKNYPQMTEQVIFTTGDVMGEVTIDFMEQARRPFLAKPFTPAELRLAVHNAINMTGKEYQVHQELVSNVN